MISSPKLNSKSKIFNITCSFNYKTAKAFIILNIVFLLASCSSSKKFSSEEYYPEGEEINIPVRLLVNEDIPSLSFVSEGTIKISDEEKVIAIVKKGNRLNIKSDGNSLELTISRKSFRSGKFIFSAEKAGGKFSFNGKNYRGFVAVNANGKIVNVVPLEEYLKGVLPAEMPMGKGTENFEVLKAFAICARTYTMVRLNEKKTDFDLYLDVRDQVYGGADNEKDLANEAIKETAGIILEYQGKPAALFYHSTCGGFTEDGGNVFANGNLPYLRSIKDGDEAYCKISPRFEWVEQYTKEEFYKRLVKNGLAPTSGYVINSINIKSRFRSGRVNELNITIRPDSVNNGETKEIKIFGNQIRSIIRTADDKSILFSNLFDIEYDAETVTIKGKGYGHGVGLCQWGAIALSRQGKNFREIINHYFPGISIEKL